MSRAIGISMTYLIPIISMFCIVGSYAIRYSTFDIFVLIISELSDFCLVSWEFRQHRLCWDLC